MATPLPFVLNDANFLERLRAAVAADHWFITSHAIKRMRERKITRQQIKSCLLSGLIVEPAALTIYGDWKATIGHRAAGDRITASVALERNESGDMAVVITTLKSGR